MHWLSLPQTMIQPMFSLTSKIQSPSASLTFVFVFEMKIQSNQQTQIWRANQNVLYFWIRSRACGGMVVFRCQKRPFRNPLMSMHVCELFRVIYLPFMVYISDLGLLYHLCELEKYLVSFPIFSAAKPVSKEILNFYARTVVDVHLKCTAFSSTSFSFSLSPSPCPCECYLRLSAIIETTAWWRSN